MKRTAIMKLGVALATLLLFAGCILQPGGEDTGTVSLAISATGGAVGASALDIQSGDDPPAAEVARVWMYTNGREFRLAPTSVSAPSSRNYAETSLSGGSGEIVIDGVPAGEGYSLVVVVGQLDGDTFVPVGYARTGQFRVSPGTATVVSPNKVNLVSDDTGVTRATFELVGTELNSVAIANETAYTASDSVLYDRGESGFSATELSLASGAEINSVSVGNWNDDTQKVAVNTTAGIYVENQLVTPADIEDVTLTGTFVVEDETGTDEVVVFYQRIGGFGGVLIENGDTGTVAADDWEDINATELNDEAGLELIDPDESPVRALTSSGNNGFFATDALGNIKITEELFTSDQELEPADLLSGSAPGFSAFNVPFPGTTRPLRLDFMEVVTVSDVEYLVVGTPRGAFTFPHESIGGSGDVFVDETNIVRTDGAGFTSLIRDEAVQALATDRTGEILAIATAETIAVIDVADGIPETRDDALILPRRGVVLGQPTGLAVQVDGANIRLYISGTEGATVLEAAR